MDTNLKKNIENIKDRIEKAKIRSGRVNDEILLIAVSKTQSYEKIIEAQTFGLNVFGENKVQELTQKYPLVNGARWHLIGHLQKNKVKNIIDKVDMIHSVDSISLAHEINRRAESIDRIIPILVQINIGKEESKSGIYKEEVLSFMENISCFENLLISGVMAVPPIDNNESTRNYFKMMKNIYEVVKKLDYKNFDIRFLSMGMSNDFEIAIEEGANIVRIGTGIFGKRVYKEE